MCFVSSNFAMGGGIALGGLFSRFFIIILLFNLFPLSLLLVFLSLCYSPLQSL
jgi:hypothetical protein